VTLVINAIFDLFGWAFRTLRKLVSGLLRAGMPGQSSFVRTLVGWAVILLVLYWAWTAVKHGLSTP
jgi:hypothetical protein